MVRDGGVRGSFRGHRAQDTEDVTEDPWVGRPEGVGLQRKSQHEHEQVREGEVDEVEVGRRVHVEVPGDDDARRYVPDDARQEYDAIDKRHRDDDV